MSGAPRITARSRQPYGKVSPVRHTVNVPMRWSDMDAYQHINNVAFLGYFEMARVNLFFEHPTHDERTGMRRGLVVHSHEIAYKRSVVYDADPLEVQVWVSGIRAASFTCHYELFDHGRLAVIGSTVLVPFDFSLERPRRITSEEKAFLQRYTDEPAA
jgi:acyl-CoA thioester hydrolase